MSIPNFKFILGFFLSLLIIPILKAQVQQEQTGTATSYSKEVFTLVEQMPSPANGYESFYRYIGKNMKFPRGGRLCFVPEYKWYVQFVVRKDGSLDDIKILKGRNNQDDEFIIKTIQSYPEKWLPGRHKGQIVDVRLKIPIIFRIN